MAGGIFSIKRVVTQQDTSMLENRSLWLLSRLFTDWHLEKKNWITDKGPVGVLTSHSTLLL